MKSTNLTKQYYFTLKGVQEYKQYFWNTKTNDVYFFGVDIIFNYEKTKKSNVD